MSSSNGHENETAASKMQMLDALLEKTAVYSKFISEKFQQSAAYKGANAEASADAENTTASNGSKAEESGKGKKRKKDTEPKKSLQEKLNNLEPERESKGAQQPELVSGGQLRDYQLIGLNWMVGLWENGMNGILGDEMGLGKTIQVISFLAHLWEKGVKGPFLVVAPLSTLQNWVNEFKKWAPSIPVMMYHANKEERNALRTKLDIATSKKRKKGAQNKKKGAAEPNQFDENEGVLPVLVTSFDIAINDRKYLQKYKWKYLVVDEAHRLKNFECKLICELRLLQTENRLLLTGTPLQNNLTELWSLLNFILPDIFDDLTSFQRWFDFTEVLEKDGDTDELANTVSPQQQLVKKLHGILRPFLLRRLKSDLDIGIPKKREMVLYCHLTPAQAAFYDAVRTKSLKKAGPRLNNILMHLRKVCNHPFLFDSSLTRDYLDPDAEAPQEEEEKKVEEETEGRKLRDKKRVNYQLEYDEGEFDKMIDKFEEEGSDEEEEKPAPKKAAAKPPRSGWNIFLKEQHAKMKKKGHSGTLSEMQREIARKWSELSDAEKKVYSVKLEQQLAVLFNDDGPSLHDDPKAYVESLVSACGKLHLVDRMIPILLRDGHKILIFSQMTKLLDLLEEYFEAKDLKYCRIDGSVAQSDRQQQIDSFNTDPSVSVFLLSTRAGGVGINLASADTVIIYDSDWNPQQDLQAQDRCHRIGQTRPVVVYRLVTARSVEERILQRAKSKMRLENLVIKKGNFKFEATKDNKLKELTSDDMREILTHDEGDSLGETGALSNEDLDRVLDRAKCFEIIEDNDKKVEQENQNTTATSSDHSASQAQQQQRKGFEVLAEVVTEF